jgi:hypothetical protein
MKLLFVNNISEVYVYKKTKVWCEYLSIKNGKRKVGNVLGIFPKYEKCYGVFDVWSDKYWGTIEEYNDSSKDEYIEDETFFYKPHCVIVSNSGEQNKVVFETDKELLSYVEELKNMGEHILIK